MAHKFSLNFKQSWIIRRGPNLIQESSNSSRGKFHPGHQKCYKYVVKNEQNLNSEHVQLVPVEQVQVQHLFGPATILSSRQIVYPCSRGKCNLPCPCLLCAKIHPRCRVGQDCGCADCRMQLKDHISFHACLHHGCKYCHKLIQIFPNFNFALLDNTRKLTNEGVFGEEKLEPSFELPPSLRLDMTAQFLRRENWSEKLKNWHCGVADDGCWCAICSTMFFSLEMFREHILSNHNTSKIFRHHCENDNEAMPPVLQCDQCTKTFKARHDLTRHIESVHYQERFECPSCDLTFSRRDNFQLHTINKHQKNPKMCKTCGMKFKNYSDFERHSEKEKCSTLNCAVCAKTFSSRSNLRRHMREAFEVCVLDCDLCESTFKRTSDLSRHKKNRDNPDGSAKFSCSICNQITCNRKLLIAHIKSKHASNKTEKYKSSATSTDCEVNSNIEKEKIEIYECEICGKHNSREDSALIHKTTHGIADKLKCDNCPTEFTLKKNFMRHQRESYDDEGNPLHECHFCNKTCCTGKLLSAHLDMEHKEDFYCTVCKRKFSLKHHWERHWKNRSSFACEACNRYFCNKKGYNEHMRLFHM